MAWLYHSVSERRGRKPDVGNLADSFAIDYPLNLLTLFFKFFLIFVGGIHCPVCIIHFDHFFIPLHVTEGFSNLLK